MTITHIFFDLHGTLVDSAKLHPCYSASLGRVMAQRYGLTAETWAQANARIVADWDSYYTDLDLTGEDGLAHMWEGWLRTTRALFRLTGVAEPDFRTLQALSRELPGLVTQSCDALFPEAKAVVEALHGAGYVLGVTSHAFVAQARGTLIGCKIDQFFQGPIVGPEVTGRFHKDAIFFVIAARLAGVTPECCLAVDDVADFLEAARAAGMQVFQICRGKAPDDPGAGRSVAGDLRGLLTYLNGHSG